MAVVEPSKPRSSASETPEGLRISIPAKRNIFVVLFVPIWLVFWAFGWVSAFAELASGGDLGGSVFLSVWLTAWTAGGAFAAFLLAWSFAGRETILLGPSTIGIARRVFGVGRSREYDLRHAANLRVAPETYNPFDFRSGMRFWGLGGGPIAFDYGASTVRFGSGVDEAEATSLVRRLGDRQPALLGKPAA